MASADSLSVANASTLQPRAAIALSFDLQKEIFLTEAQRHGDGGEWAWIGGCEDRSVLRKRALTARGARPLSGSSDLMKTSVSLCLREKPKIEQVGGRDGDPAFR